MNGVICHHFDHNGVGQRILWGSRFFIELSYYAGLTLSRADLGIEFVINSLFSTIEGDMLVQCKKEIK
jgi:hypothetical protein